MSASENSSAPCAKPAEMPDNRGRFGNFGGRYVPETLMPALAQLEEAHRQAQEDPEFQAVLARLRKDYVGRPTPLYEAERLSARLGGPRIFLKREDLAHTGAHKINNALAQGLLAKRMGKTRLIADTGAGQHGVATATAAAFLGLECMVHMGEVDMERQALNVTRMRLLGATVQPVTVGARTLKEAVSAAIRDWVTNIADTHYIIGSVMGPHPYPMLVRDYQSVIGREAREQVLAATGALPKALVACVGGGSNAMGLFHAFVEDQDVEMRAVEAAGHGIETGRHSACLTAGTPGVLHGSMMLVLQDAWGQILEAHSVAAGLDYPGVGPELCRMKECGRVKSYAVTDDQAVAAFRLMSQCEGIIPALESSHALAHLVEAAGDFGPGDVVVMCLSGRGDKDVVQI